MESKYLQSRALELQSELSPKQDLALTKLTDKVTQEIVFGGAKNGGKSYLGCVFIFGQALSYPETNWFIMRNELNDLRKFTIPSIGEVFKSWDLVLSNYADFNGQDNVYTLYNGSKVFLLAAKYLPLDPMFERFGSMQFTGGWIEEGGEIHAMAYENIKLSIGRWKNDEYELLGKLLITCNPKKNWLYTDFYKPYKDKKLDKKKAFIQALVTDNLFRQSGSVERLDAIKDSVTKQRLRHGVWEYESDPSCLIEYDAIQDLFTNDHVKPTGKNYIAADLAMKGRDKFIAAPWNGLICDLTKGIDKNFSTGKEIEGDLKQLMIKNLVPHSRTIVDSDGLGSYLESYLKGIKEFHGGGKAKDAEFANNKSECGYKLAELVNKRLVKIICSEEQKRYICEELETLKAADLDSDEKKKRIIKKEDMKAIIGRSPDYLDMLLMRMYFEINTTFFTKPTVTILRNPKLS